MGPRTPTEMDRLVGQRIRLARKMAKLSQTQLGQIVGVTYQQIQKYENGNDRIGAGRLYGIAQSTNQSIAFFFSSAEADVDSRLSGDILADPKMQKLITAVARLENDGYVSNLISIADTFAANEFSD